jgi:hypothetical protein
MNSHKTFQSCSKWQTLGALSLLLVFADAQAGPPVLFHQSGYQSPVRGDPDDLLLLAGCGLATDDTVVYQLLDDSSKRSNPPLTVPTQSTQLAGTAPVVSNLGVPNSLTIRLPEAMLANQTYSLWVRTHEGTWSNAVMINDARPLWLSPAYVYASERVASLPRYLKVVGRNLQPAAAQVTRIRLSGPQTVILQAITDAQRPVLNEYVARITLPERLTVGNYDVAISRDGRSWVSLAGQRLQVLADPGNSAEYRVDNPQFGNCHPDDNQDDASCVQRAIAAAETAGGGTIFFGAGTWDMIDAKRIGLVKGEGIRLPRNIKLYGAGSDSTVLIRHPRWNEDGPHPAFSLDGGNDIRGFRFHDTQRYTTIFQAAAFLQLGRQYEHDTTEAASRTITDVAITENIFDKPGIAIEDVGLPIKRLFITYNEFGAYHEAIRLAGNLFNMRDHFRIDDSVISYNTFYPGSWLDPANRQGAIASELGAGYRVDFSDNQADGAAEKYLNSPDDAHGWRASFFWHLNGNQEKLLISANTATCTGDKIGDGEAIAFDNNGNTFAFDTAKAVLDATGNSVTVPGPLLTMQNNRDVPTASYYIGHWIQIGAGQGLGQVRKIVSYSVNAQTQAITFTIAPSWDVIPQVNQTQLSIGREFWQAHVVANTVDHRKPPCMKSNRSEPKGGTIGIWAQTADSVVAGNQMFDTDGVLFHNQFTARETSCADCYRGTHYVSFMEIRDNLIDGEYDWDTDCSSSGITGSLAASPGTPPLTVNYGLTIAHNTINHADAKLGGAITMTPAWYNGPAPYRWPLVDTFLIHHNTITDMWSDRARACRNQPAAPRTAISLGGSSLVWRSVLYANVCDKIPQVVNLLGAQQITRICKPGMSGCCECQR